MKTKICTIDGNHYYVSEDVSPEKRILLRNKEPIAVIIRKEYESWRGHRVKFRPYSSPAELDYLDEDGLTALDEAIDYLKQNFGT